MNPPKHTEKLDIDRMWALSMRWIPVTESLPDDDETVLIAMTDGEAWTGYHEANQWFYVSGEPINYETITHWMHFPDTPMLMEQEAA